MKSINPKNGKLIKEYHEHSPKAVLDTIESTHYAFQIWSQLDFDKRAACMYRAAKNLRNNVEKYAKLITDEVGKPLKESRAEVIKSATACEFFAENAASFLKPEKINAQEGTSSWITFEPLGVILGIMPWNYPFWQVFRFGASTIMAGNAILLKHAPNVSGCALTIQTLLEESNFPKNLFSVLLVKTEAIPSIISHKHVKGVALTGSDRAGISVATEAGKALKKTVLELGGSDPFIVLKDASMDNCVSTALSARLGNCGQSCIAAKRFIVVKDVVKSFCDKLKERIQKIKVGDPTHEEIEMGPIARDDLLRNLERQVQESVKKGAQIICGGQRLDREGYYFPPTLLVNVKKGMPAYDEEIFGPVFSVIAVEDVEEAIAVANDSVYGLGASLWTQDMKLAQQLAKRIEAGGVFVNAKTVSNIKLPFGGIKRSGYGRELSHYGIKEFVNIKTLSFTTEDTKNTEKKN